MIPRLTYDSHEHARGFLAGYRDGYNEPRSGIFCAGNADFVRGYLDGHAHGSAIRTDEIIRQHRSMP